MSLGTRSLIFGPGNKMDSVPSLTEFTLLLCNASLAENNMGVSREQIYHLKCVHARLCKFL